MIVRINYVGRAEAIDYRNFQYRPQEAENKYYLTRWAELYFSRNRFTIERDQTAALYFLNADVQRAMINQERKGSMIQTYVGDSGLPFVDVEMNNVVLGACANPLALPASNWRRSLQIPRITPG